MISTVEAWQKRIDEHYFNIKEIIDKVCETKMVEEFAQSHIDGKTHRCWLIMRDARQAFLNSKEALNHLDITLLHALCLDYVQVLKERIAT